jgi:hypothetical protein
MSVIDNRGRLFGLVNLVDAAVVGFVLVLMPVAYGTYLLFRPAKPHIESVSLAAITREETRIAGGGGLSTKWKVKGSGLNPLLRAMVGDSAALGFVFENPNSADVLVGPVGPGDHDLILYDGIQEVARAAGAVKIPADQPGASSFIRGVGHFVGLAPAAATGLKVGYKYPDANPDFEILALGSVQPARTTVRLANSQLDIHLQGLVEREAVLRIRCDHSLSNNPCAVGARLAGALSFAVALAGPDKPFSFMVEEVLPESSGQKARLQVRLTGGPHLSTLKVGDRDRFLDERAAVVTSIGARGPETVTVTLDLGLDETRGGWQYRAQRVKPGAPFTLETDRYEAVGRIETVELVTADRRGGS